MSAWRRFYVVLAVGLFCWNSHVYGQTAFRRPSVKYAQIHTDSFRIIYPIGLERTAQRVANLASAMSRQRPFQDGASLRKIDILLQNATDIPNGYVGLGPWRSEFYLTPPQNSFDLGSLSWPDLLTLHEFRHVQQNSAARKGITKWMYYVFGEQAYSAAFHLSTPDWFTEGDAVVAETALSPQGRGRLPAFFNGYREMVRTGADWKYMKVRNGSYVDYLPSEYPLGYLLVNYGREKYGQGFWDSVMVDGAKYKGLFYSFSRAMQLRTGLKSDEFYHAAMDAYRTRWRQDDQPAETSVSLVQEPDNRFRDFSYPVYNTRGDLYTMVSSYDRITYVCRIDSAGYHPLIATGFQTEPVLSAGGQKLCWTELRRHPRWWREDYSVIVTYDLDKGNKRTLTHHSSYFMPALSSDGRMLVAVHDNDLQQYALHVLNEEGEIQYELPNPNHYFYTFPQWLPGDTHLLCAVRLPDGRMTLVIQAISDGAITELLEPSFAPIGRPWNSGEWTYFTRTSGGQDQIFRIHRSTRYVEQVTTDDRPRYQPVIDPVTGHLVFVEFGLTGNKLRKMPLDEKRISLVRGALPGLAEVHLEHAEHDLLHADTIKFNPSAYPLMTRPIRLHSWMLYADDPIYGLELLSDNTLNTIRARGGWEFNQNTRDHGPFAELTFGMWYPEILAGYSSRHIKRTVQDRTFTWWQHRIHAGVRVPFYSYSGPYSQSGAISTRVNRIFNTGNVGKFAFNYLSHTLNFSNARKQAYQHAESRFSQSVLVRYSHAVDTASASQFHIESDVTIPSPLRNQFFWLEFDYRKEAVSNDVQFDDLFDYARGYDPVDGDQVWRAGVNYQLPVAYPDAGFAGLVYVRRVRLNPFFDYMRVDAADYRSVGLEVYADLHVFNVQPVSIGFRYARRLDADQGNDFALIIPTRF